jgi:hypothetical protein
MMRARVEMTIALTYSIIAHLRDKILDPDPYILERTIGTSHRSLQAVSCPSTCAACEIPKDEL